MSLESIIFSLIALILGVVMLPLIFLHFVYPSLMQRKPYVAAIAAAFFVMIGFMTAFFTFYNGISIAMLAFSSLMLLPFIIKILETPPKPAWRPKGNHEGFRGILLTFTKHEGLISLYTFMFFGMALEYMLLFAFLPPTLGNMAFSSQLSALGPAGQFGTPSLFAMIIANNMQILIIAFALSIFFGAGSIFILGYNASLAGVVYASPIRTLVWGLPAQAWYANVLSFIPHTVLEILAYLLAAVAGGILVRGLSDENVRDALTIFGVSIALIPIAALVEITVPFM